MFISLIYFNTFLKLWAHTIANIHINVQKSHLLWQFFFAVCTPYSKYSHQCLQVPSTFAVFLCCVHTVLQIFSSMFTGPVYFCNCSLLWAHLMANILINVHSSHLMQHLFVIVGAHYSKYAHQCSQVPSTLPVFRCCAHILRQKFTSMFIGPIYFGSFSTLCTHSMTNMFINVHSHLILQLFLMQAHRNKKTSFKHSSEQEIETNTRCVETCFEKVTAEKIVKKTN